MTNQISSLIAALFILFSCGGGPKKTATGYEYKFYKDEPGQNATAGQVAYFDFEIVDDKANVIQSTKGNPQPPNILLPAKDDKIVKQNPIISLLYNCSVGDSVGLIMPKDSIPNAGPQYENVAFFEYKIKINEIISEEEHKARIDEFRKEEEAKLEATKAREAEIGALATTTAAAYKAGTLEGLQEGPQGMKYIIHEEGTGPKAVNGQFATVQYYGYLEDGTMFDNSFKRGKGYGFKLGQGSVIKGWDLGIPLLNKGAKATIFIPSELGYGKRGSPPNIQPDTDLIFYVELENIN